jgi:hypothetical protein
MATVGTAPNDPSDDRSVTEIDDREEKHHEEDVTEGSESETSVTDGLSTDDGKIAELQKRKRQITAQYTRVLKQRDDNVRKHAQVLQNKKIVVNGTKKLHKTEVHELRAQLKRLKSEAKDELRGELKIKDAEKNLLRNQLKDSEKGRKKDELELKKLQASLSKEQAVLSDLRMVYATARRNIDVLTASVKEVTSSNKKLKKKQQSDLSLKYEHDEKMMQMQLRRERYISERDKDKRDAKDASDKMLLDNKKAQTNLVFNLRKQSKDDDIVRRDNVKKSKEVKECEDVGVIAAGMRNKQMQINNGQFNAHVSLDKVCIWK